jgi:branched-chain amino acid aminotransferase
MSPIFRKDQEIIGDIKKLIEANNVKNLNVKLLSAYEEGKKETFLAYFIESYYPDEKVYREGIHTILYHYERKNPNAKVLNVSFKDEVNKKIKEMNAFEALLVNKEGYITEGSRSNMFFVRGEKVFTAPKGEVLLGVTRKHIINVCKELNIDVVEENINIKDLDKIDGGFMSGTSVNVLPISSIDDKKYSSADNNLIKAIQDGYLNLVKNYIEEKKSLCK